ncbi:MAG: DUF2330 domain-containing protein [Deltaproteobacteria bacterium]|nr:MAG: DUF2330 domain-containing protein [Deltaproteobacteria bacterium]
MTLLALLTALTPTASACGGFFCDVQQPIYQAGEEIVFAVDDEACEVTAHIGIQYEGAAEDFAWIVPVSGNPDLFTSHSAIFGALRTPTDPTYSLRREERGICASEARLFEAATDDAEMDSGEFADTAFPSDGGDGVNVIGQERVGPYETVTLQALNATVLISWLQDNGYDLPDALEDTLQPYVNDNQFFVALKLAAGQDAGDLMPLGMRYAGCGASVPIQLTSVAAVADMPVDVYIAADARAVPDNYLHVTLNDAAIDWFSGGSNIGQVIATAADEAGGNAFHTMFSGAMPATLVYRGNFSQTQLAATTDAFAFVGRLRFDYGIPITPELTSILEDVLPMSNDAIANGIPAAQYYQCMDCWGGSYPSFDATAAAERIATELIPALDEAQALIDDYPHLTRLSTTLDPEEMTTDPMFVLNRDLPQNIASGGMATEVLQCGLLERRDKAERLLQLADGREVKLPSRDWVSRHGTSEMELMGELESPAAILIEDYGAEGMGEIVFDFRDEALRDARRTPRAGCGCQSTSVPWSLGSLLLLLPALARRRR